MAEQSIQNIVRKFKAMAWNGQELSAIFERGQADMPIKEHFKN